jgi:hypothetical protein
VDTNENYLRVLGEIYVQFKRSEVAYKDYLNNDKKFLHAKILKTANTRIRSLLIKNFYLLPSYLETGALELIAHYDIWFEKWQDLKKNLNPGLDDQFVFQNATTFPKEACISLEKEFLKLKNEQQIK